MSGPITWRNVEGPSFRDVNQGMVNSAAMFSNAFSGLKDVLKEREATELANWEAMKERNTTDILTRAAAAATPEEAKALKADLLGRMQGMGAQVDTRAVLPVVQGMEAKLQEQAIKAMQHTTQTQQFNDSQDDRKTQDQALTLRSIVAGAQDAGSVQAALNAGQAYVGNNMLTPRQMLQLSQEAVARDAVIANRLEDERNGQAQRTHWSNQDKVAMARAEADKVTAQQTAERLLLEAHAKNTKSQADILEKTNAVVQAAKNNPYLRTINSSDKDRETFRSSLKDKGLKAPEIDALIEKITTTPFYVTDKATGKKVAIEPSISALQNVLNSRESWLLGNFFGAADRNYVSAVQNYIDTQPDYYTNLAAAQRDLALVSQRAPNPEQGNQGIPTATGQTATTSAPVANAAADPASPARAAATSIWEAKVNQAQDSYSRMYKEKEAQRLAQAQAAAAAGSQSKAQLQAGLNGVFPNNPQLAQLEKELKETVSNEAKLREQYGGKMYDQKVSRLQSKIDSLRQPVAPAISSASASPATSPLVKALDKAAEAAASKPSTYENGTLTFGADKNVNVSAAPGVNFKGFGGNGTKIRFGDADTLEISGSGGEKIKLRSFNIDGVESDQKLGKEARQLVEGLLSNASNVQVVISDSKKEKNGRQLGDIFVDGQSLNKLMVSAGYAQVLPGKMSGMSPAEEREMLALQQEAQLAKRGQWGLKPWEGISPALHRAWGDTLTPPELRK